MTRYECTKCCEGNDKLACVQIVPNGTIYKANRCIANKLFTAEFKEVNW